MPIFDYQCARCQHEFTEVVSLNSKYNPKCPKCRCKKTKKIFNFSCKMTGKSKIGTEDEARAVSHAILDNLIAKLKR